MYNFFIFSTYYILILISIIGYGLCSLKLLKIKVNFVNFGYIGLLGIYVLIVYSYFSNFFIAHNETHNFIILFIGLIIFIYLVKQKFSSYKKEFFFLLQFLFYYFALYFSLKIMMTFHIIIFLTHITSHNKVYI